MTPSFILASSSPYRRAQWEERFTLPITCISPMIDEQEMADEHPEKLAKRLSVEKAKSVAARIGHSSTPSYIIAGDQTADFEGSILRKPGDIDRANKQLNTFQGKTITFYSGICVFNVSSGEYQSTIAKTRVKFRTLNDAQIRAYTQADKPVDCVGAFKNEALGIALFEHIESHDPTALTGLPLIALVRIFDEMGVDLLSLSASAQA